MFDERVTADMDVALDSVCRELPNGGDHAFENESLKNSSIIENGLPEQLMRTCRLGF